MLFEQAIRKVNTNPRVLFLIDGLGAILSVFLLGVVLVKLENVFGIPSSTLYILATLPIFFAVYDFYCYQKDTDKIAVFLKGIAVMNCLYCCLSIGFAFYHYQVITLFGWIYILFEVLIIINIVNIQYNVSEKLISKKT